MPPIQAETRAQASEDRTDDEPASDNDRLISALQMCFKDLLNKQEEQIQNQQEQVVHFLKLRKAVEALKPQTPVTDNKTTFWNSYMKLADEYDKEFQRKYSTDLDTGLIFAGLFSAVGSAFIIQIQQQITPNPPSGAPSQIVVVVVQSLLYVSLFTTLLAALLAVLGKQWIMSYEAAGSRGTIAERGLERQRKLDGLRKWKFDAVLQMFPLLLQLALLLFAVALSIYLWMVHVAIAIIVLTLTCLGVAAYVFLVVSAIISPDSPFQTPLAIFLAQVIPITKMEEMGYQLRKLVDGLRSTLSRLPCSGTAIPASFASSAPIPAQSGPESLDPFAHIFLMPPSLEVPAVVWVLETSTDPTMISTAAEIAVDLQWPLDLDLTSPMTRLGDIFKSCLQVSFRDGRPVQEVRAGMAQRAINCGRAYCALRLIHRSHRDDALDPVLFWLRGEPMKAEINNPAQLALRNVVRIIGEFPELVDDPETPLHVQWALHVIPSLHPDLDVEAKVTHFLDQFQDGRISSLDLTSFTNYLTCVNTFFTPLDPQVITQINKRRFQYHLLLHLFKALQTAMDGAPALVAKIVITTARLAKLLQENWSTWMMVDLITEVSQFCCHFPRVHGWLDVVMSAATLARVNQVEHLEALHRGTHPDKISPQDATWIYVALEHVQRAHQTNVGVSAGLLNNWNNDTILAVEGLLQILAFSPRLEIPSLECFDTIRYALFTPGDISWAAFLVLVQAPDWFQHPALQITMQQAIIWPQLGRVALKYPALACGRYIGIGTKIAEIPEWKPFVYRDLPTWITLFSSKGWGRPDIPRDPFISVLRTVWVPDFDQHRFADTTENTWALALTALSNVWGSFDFSDARNLHEVPRLGHCTVSAALQVKYFIRQPWTEPSYDEKMISPSPRAIFAAHLGQSLTEAAARVRRVLKEYGHGHGGPGSMSGVIPSTQDLERMAELLGELGRKIGTEFEPGSGEVRFGKSRKTYKDWSDLERQLQAEMDGLEECLVS
ncbi:hypothetical protein C8R44DRAFT_856153 [Mycena epipterygia]|nr:hypothetical protein C8R44DRAFT_856153 [Mycena epipterygia]